MLKGCSVQFFADLYTTIGHIINDTLYDNTGHVQSFLSVYNLKNSCEAGDDTVFQEFLEIDAHMHTVDTRHSFPPPPVLGVNMLTKLSS